MQRKRSLDEVHGLTRFDGNIVVLKGHPTRGIPEDSSIRICTIEGNVIKEDIATDEYSIKVDPGRYIYSIRKMYPGTKRGFRYVAEFQVGITDKQWQAMEYMEPLFSGVRQTTQGPRWFCRALACGHSSVSKVSALEHEASHKGLSFLEAVDAKAVEQKLTEGAQEIREEAAAAQATSAPRRRGRPPKNASVRSASRRPPTSMRKAGDFTTNVPGVAGD